jgi:hypothetical protein
MVRRDAPARNDDGRPEAAVAQGGGVKRYLRPKCIVHIVTGLPW